MSDYTIVVNCPDCKGTGKSFDGIYTFGLLGIPLLMDFDGCWHECSTCDGTGKVRVKPPIYKG